jgi:hypothetical protein
MPDILLAVVYVWGVKVHARCTGGVFEKQASKSSHEVLIDRALDLLAMGGIQIGRNTLATVFGMLGAFICACVPPYPPHAWHTSGINIVKRHE